MSCVGQGACLERWRLQNSYIIWCLLIGWIFLSSAYAAPTFVKDDSCDDLPVSVICGTVDVPENQLTDSGPTIQLDVYVLKAKGDVKVPDPIVFLDGGPGSRATSNFAALADMEKLRDSRDIVIVNQRGTSTAQWLCPTYELDEAFITSADVSFAESNRRTAGVIKDCYERLREIGQEPANYTNHANAQDFKDVRLALGVDQWNLWGTSYGTALAQEIIKVDPEGVRSAVMDSVVPLDKGWARGGDDHYRAAFDALNEECQADAQCASRFGDLHDLRRRALETLQEKPIRFDEGIGNFRFEDEKLYETYVIGKDRDLHLNDHDLSSYIFTYLYTEYYFPIIPLLLDRVVARDQRFMELIIDNMVGGVPDADTGVYFAMACRFPMPTEQEMQDEFDRNKEWLAGIPEVRYLPDICAELDLPPVDPKDWELPTSDVPALIISGLRDPITPVAFGDHLAASLPNAQVSIFTHQSHGPGYSMCGLTLLKDFFDRPFKTKIRDCDQTEQKTEFLTDVIGTTETVDLAKTPKEGFWSFARVYTSIILACTIAVLGFILLSIGIARRGFSASYQEGVLVSHTALAIAGAASVLTLYWFAASAAVTADVHTLAIRYGIGVVPMFGPWMVWAVPVFFGALLVAFFELLRIGRTGLVSVGDTGFQLSLILSISWIGAFLVYFGVHPETGWDWWRWVSDSLHLKFFFF